jgi:hypothetical protein
MPPASMGRPAAAHRSTNTSSAVVTAAMTALTRPSPRYLPSTSSSELTGEMRNSSIAPLSRSRTKDRAVSVTAMCCRMSARTAGAEKDTTDGSLGAMFSVRTVVGAAMTSGGMSVISWPTRRRRRTRLPANGRAQDLLVDLARQERREEAGVAGVDRIDGVDHDARSRLPPSAERLARVGGGTTTIMSSFLLGQRLARLPRHPGSHRER